MALSLTYKMGRAADRVMRAHIAQAEKMRREAEEMRSEVYTYIVCTYQESHLQANARIARMENEAQKNLAHEEANRMNWDREFGR